MDRGLTLAGVALLLTRVTDAITMNHPIAFACNSIPVRLGQSSFGDRWSWR